MSGFTLCWDCKNACGGCNWSKNLAPVKGWEVKIARSKCQVSYLVVRCPEFKRDAIGGGIKRYREEHDDK